MFFNNPLAHVESHRAFFKDLSINNNIYPTQIWKTVSTVTLWTLWKYRCKRRYDSIVPLLSDILLELWDNLLAVVRGQYDNMSGPSEVVLKKRKKLLQLWRKLPLFTISSQGPIWKYHHPWPFP